MINREKRTVSRGINHVGLTVPNLQQATEFLQKALDARFVYDGLTDSDSPREGADTERQLGLTEGSMIIKQRLLRIGNGPNLELFEIVSSEQAQPVRLQDFGWNHISLYVDDIHYAVERVRAAGGQFLSEIHGNSRHEDTDDNASVYFKAPWGSLIELQSIPNGYYYPEDSEADTWIPER
ncbi:VOC family protein [Klebsiella oxytoca]|uniref:VOC family protein n=1 Tax=Klebsiella TaxID=570 RepID=UPI00062C7D1C|nr:MULTISPECIES: VOC family protein [Klebsiella]HAV1879797.1 glyoxalase/bleomycin resistance/dioxygenase family protein [Enterobacter hormaechei subsp. steigerwaltii]HBT6829852.1 glyoxalase/bleomycin resistance/dioxygenase family protein [Klebsiella pneumoniae]HDK7114469.1 VOC family protein [Klebsiella variicola]KKY75640.1 glyoxalase [Klebsiella michiganensis]MBF8467230.1 glyoxalase/bleomycin resistance/dioxygenase family protein [Klebsiella oxytoca]